MSRDEFEQLRDLPNKRISQDIQFMPHPQAGPNLIFDHVVVENDGEHDILLNGTYKPGIPAVTFNFVVRGVGPVCRVDVNGSIHGAAGRTHKHDLRAESDPRRNLPTAFARPDLDAASVLDIWDQLCELAQIDHTGTFVAPDGDDT